MRWNRLGMRAAVVGLALASVPGWLTAEEIWTTRDGTLTLIIPRDAASRMGLTILNARHGFEPGATGLASSSPRDTVLTLELAMEAGSDLGFVAVADNVLDLLGLHLQVAEGLDLAWAERPYSVVSFDVLPEGSAARDVRQALRPVGHASLATPQGPVDETVAQPGYLELVGVKTVFDPLAKRFTLASREVRIPRALAEALGRPDLAGASIGRAVVEADAHWIGGDAPSPPPPVAPVDPDSAARGGIGPDMTFCQLYGLRQYGRSGDIVGLSLATTSWNVGDASLPWFARPNVNHPFIVMNMYRLRTVEGSERFEQIGQSWIKHAFCALDSSQCTTTCQKTGCSTLGVGCTDTYSAFLNADPRGLGPRHEVDPWRREWTCPGSHLCAGFHSHGPIEHRIQVQDADLDPAQNAGAAYYGEGYYVCPEDVNQMNSAAWKPTTVDGAPGGTWTFGMSSSSHVPEIGFAIAAWTGATQMVLAQEVPVVEFVSPDGRCVLAATATDLGGGMWHYEYALLNVDMDRKVASFRIPIDEQALIENIGFHAVESHDEPYSNDPWIVAVAGGAITWSTTDNPLRWGTLYNFRFDIGVGPTFETPVTLGLYEPGDPSTVTGITIGPIPEPADCNDNAIADTCDVACGAPGGECDVPDCGGSADCDANGIPDECDPDFDDDGLIDACDPDIDNDGVLNDADLCDFTPPGTPITENGRPLGDLDSDCAVTLGDYRLFDNCILASGPGVPGSEVCVSSFDFDGDGNIDLKDFGGIQDWFTGGE